MSKTVAKKTSEKTTARGTARTDRAQEKAQKSRAAAKRTASSKKRAAAAPEPVAKKDGCHHCQTNLERSDRALFVEEEIGRIFCSEECISEFFAADVERLEREYLRRLSNSDLSGEEKEKLAHLRWVTLEEPDEIWREKTLSGDHRYTLISEFRPGNRSVWCVCVCLFLRGEPSFLFIAFPTRNEAMVAHYRRGERVQWSKPARQETARIEQQEASGADPATADKVMMTPSGPRLIDGLADSWTEDETRRAQQIQRRRSDDIPSEEFEEYHSCLEETLEGPNEVWTIQLDEDESQDSSSAAGQDSRNSGESADPVEQLKIYHFIRRYPTDRKGYWYVIVARETENEEEIEILDAFPTRDGDLVESYRRGVQEVGQSEQSSQSRLVH